MSSSEEAPLLQNPAGAGWIIQKYGGTSVGKFLDQIAGNIIPSYLDQSRLAIVCSARSGQTKALGTTNLLLKAASQALSPPNNANQSANGSPSSSIPSTPQIINQRNFTNYFPPLSEPSTPGTQTPSSRFNGLKSGTSRSASPSPFVPFSSMTPQASSSSLSNSVSSLSESPVIGSAPTPQSLSSFHETVDQIRKDHLAAAREAVNDKDLLALLEDEIERDTEGLRSFLFAAQIIDEISDRSKDSIIGIGERLSCKIVAAALRDRGIDSELVSFEHIVQATYAGEDEPTDGDSHQLDQVFYDRLARKMGERLKECGDRVPVVTGYFGVVPGSLLKQVGRGYTDLCASLCAVGVQATELQVWKEVDGIFTADPRKVPTARLIPIITPDEAAELTYYGSEVIHPFTMEQVIRASIPIRIKNVENPKGGGTVIYPNSTTPVDAEDEAKGTSSRNRFPEKLPTAVTIKDDILVINIHSNRKTISHGFLARIFGTLDRFGVVVDLISTSEVHISMAIHAGINKRDIEKMVKELKKMGTVTVVNDMAILSLVGHLKNMIGISGRMFTTLAEGNVNIEMISQGASEINISCVIEARDAVKALNLVHRSCLSPAAIEAASAAQ